MCGSPIQALQLFRHGHRAPQGPAPIPLVGKRVEPACYVTGRFDAQFLRRVAIRSENDDCHGLVCANVARDLYAIGSVHALPSSAASPIATRVTVSAV